MAQIPAPPEGYITCNTGGALRELPSTAPFRVGDRGDYSRPIDGVLVYAEGDWRPVVHFRARYRRSVTLDYTGSPLANAQVHNTYEQRVVPERIAVRPDVIPRWIGMQKNEAERVRKLREAAESKPARREPTLDERIEFARARVEIAQEEVDRATRVLAERQAELRALTGGKVGQ